MVEATNNFKSMPNLLKVMVLLGGLAPVIAFFSLLSISRTQTALNLVECILLLAGTLPISFSAYKLVIKARFSNFIYFAGWLFLIVSPLALSSVRQNVDVFLMNFVMNICAGILLFLYLTFSPSVKNYMKS